MKTLIIFQAFLCPYWSSLTIEVKCIWLAVHSDGARESGFNSNCEISPGTTSAWKISINGCLSYFFLVAKLQNVELWVKRSSRHFTF